MSSIIPAVIPQSKEHLLATLEVFSSFASEVQIDIVDGVFAHEASWPYKEETPLEKALTNIVVPPGAEFDLMIQDPLRTLSLWSDKRPERIVIHMETADDLSEIFVHKEKNGYKLGLAINNDTPLETLLTLDAEKFDYIELMGIDEIGVQGQPFDERVLTRIREIRSAYPEIEISIDGSVNEATLPLLKEAGANRFVVGSAILNAENPAEMYRKLSALAV